MSAFDEMYAAMNEATDRIKAADNAANRMAGLLCGRLRKVSPLILRDLKRELDNYNMRTLEWKP